MKRLVGVAPGVVLLVTLASGQVGPVPGQFDVILRHGTVLDGSGLTPYRADVGIANGHIARISDLTGNRAAVDVDVNGLFVAPGFINIHSHAQPDALPTAANMLTQGVTTEIVNADGGGTTDIAQQLSQWSARGLAVNLGAYIGFNSVWAGVMGSTDHRATPDDIKRMQTMITTNLERGAWGVSAGLDYKPGYFALTDEVIAVVKVAAAWRTDFPNHERVTPESNYSGRAGIAETIEIGEKAGLVPVITHMKVQGREQGSAATEIDMMRQATARGHYTAADIYPYLAGMTGLGQLTLPAWALAGGPDEMLKRFKDLELRRRIARETEETIQARFGGPESIYLPAIRRQFVDIMRDLHASAGEALIQTLENNAQSARFAIIRFGIESDLLQLLRNPVAAIACDCGATLETRTHPRLYGTFPRVLGHYVRETKTLTWEDAVRKMTGLPANTIGLVDRGFLAPGMAADITVFDPNAVIDRATYENPAAASEGIRHVLVNGRFALRDGTVTAEQGGQTLARSRHMPSRPMIVGATRRASVKGTAVDSLSGEIHISLDLIQNGGTSLAKGSVRLSDPRSKTKIQLTTPGLLQASSNWASITGRARILPSGDERSLTVILEQVDPFAANHGATVVIDVEDMYHFSGSIAPQNVHLVQRPSTSGLSNTTIQ